MPTMGGGGEMDGVSSFSLPAREGLNAAEVTGDHRGFHLPDTVIPCWPSLKAQFTLGAPGRGWG